MRGQAKNVRSLPLTGKVYLKYQDYDEEAEDTVEPGDGDILLYLNNDADDRIYYKGGYHKKGHAGYFKGSVYDRGEWKPLMVQDIFEEKENYFTKSAFPIDIFNYCKEILEGLADTLVYRSYREHFSPYLHTSTNPYKGRKGQMQKK
jgi:hypothetical protein